MPKVNLLDGSGVPRRSELNLNGFEMSVVADDHSSLTVNQKFLVEFFESKTDGKRLANRNDFEPEEIIKYLPYVTIFDLDVNDRGEINDIKVRLFGTALSDFYGEWTGRYLKADDRKDSLKLTHPKTYKRIFAMTALLLIKRKAVSLFSDQVSAERSYWKIRNLAIPFSRNGTDIDMLFMYTELNNEP